MAKKIVPESKLGKILENPWIPEKTRKNLLLYNLIEQGERKDIMDNGGHYGRAVLSPEEYELGEKLQKEEGLVRLDFNEKQEIFDIAITSEGVDEIRGYDPKTDLDYLEKPFLKRLSTGLKERGESYFPKKED